ncbi:G-protein coupled receptor 183 [Astyanax mexicanus]|uniref:G-protein coupled receptor 183 n=1 Tax=Astyanax mexicanus TaxID=7994 RepID=A0A8B9HPM0_ASTMX|nr:G-protein coupled receptor 183 [Astyanax mexicanus]KAG9271067.1 G-protein coupled receptor 183 [Astyanax mexicanus]
METQAPLNVSSFFSKENVSDHSCNVFMFKDAAQVLFPIFYITLLVISVSGNSLVLYITCQRKQKFNSTSLYLINLAISDTLFTLALPGRITYYIRGFDWPFGDLLCRLTAVIFFANTYAGIAFMTCISVDRYLAMVHPHRCLTLRKIKTVRGVCALVWAIIVLETSPLLFRNMMKDWENQRTCMEYSSLDASPKMPYMLLFACAIGFCVPLGVIMGCYSKINSKLSRMAKENPMTGRSGKSQRAKNVILLILLSFVVCFGPYHFNIIQFMVRRLLREPSCEEKKAFKMSLQVTVSMMNLNCCLDPVIYFFAIKTYKQRVMSLFKGYIPSLSSKSMPENSSSNT